VPASAGYAEEVRWRGSEAIASVVAVLQEDDRWIRLARGGRAWTSPCAPGV
jgi:hypothetical protein